MTEYRASFDASIAFRNGGGLQAQGFRLDIPGSRIEDAELGELFVRHLGLLMVSRVEVANVEIVEEQHKGSRGVPVAPAGRRLVDLSHAVRDGMISFPGLPGPQIRPHLTHEQSRPHYAPGTEFRIDHIGMVGNTGTYLDSPFHRYPDGTDLADLPLDVLADLPITLARLTGSATRAIDTVALRALPVRGHAVLLHTGWAARWGTDAYQEPGPFLTGEAARWLAESGAVLVGIDAMNVDDTDPAAGGERPAHSILLAAGIPVLEHLTSLDRLPVDGARLHAAPPRVERFSTFPVRAYAVIDG